MGRKPKGGKGGASADEPNPLAVKDKDVMQRLNFLYQTSVYLAQIAQGMPSAPDLGPKVGSSTEKTSQQRRERKRTGGGGGKDKTGRESLLNLSKQHTRTIKAIGNKAVLRIDPTVKRTICKGCQTVLIPGVTASVRIKPSAIHSHLARYTCLACRTSRKFPAPPTIQSTHLSAEAKAQGTTVTRSEDVADPSTRMEQDDTQALEVSETTKAKRSNSNGKRKAKRPRLPPLFERDVGHVVFAGSERESKQS